jgi:hypothetical protein
MNIWLTLTNTRATGGAAVKTFSSAGNRSSNAGRSLELNSASTLNVLSGTKRDERTNRNNRWLPSLISLLLLSLLFSGWLREESVFRMA